MNAENDRNSDEEFEEEELLLYLDFQSKIKPETLQKPNVQIKMIGFENEPIVQINNKMFRGVFEHAMGTNVFFSENPSPPPMDPNFESIPSTTYKYHSQTDKVLKMERIFITPKQDNDEVDETNEQQQCDEDDIPNESYLEALNHLLKPGDLPPRTMSGSDILKPAEFKTFFRPQSNDPVADNEQSESTNHSMETNDNDDEITEASGETNASEASGSTMQLGVAQVKIEKIKLEKQ